MTTTATAAPLTATQTEAVDVLNSLYPAYIKAAGAESLAIAAGKGAPFDHISATVDALSALIWPTNPAAFRAELSRSWGGEDVRHFVELFTAAAEAEARTWSITNAAGEEFVTPESGAYYAAQTDAALMRMGVMAVFDADGYERRVTFDASTGRRFYA
ncbi:hypothetical protein SAMN04515671_2904 [Nakamurella panacisegetis]|uniref:Uncharacterized protein n=1 Tax=Nakamurella panacisegetis TaxID=1090615 RepID=A0A1H0PU06_9ACTN|nr:hypothetical protein [Nakamurella panacisegetis]SDP08593.1 hypothetical protein SAMN04515671_2904 [Nakamurella panacisegetis]